MSIHSKLNTYAYNRSKNKLPYYFLVAGKDPTLLYLKAKQNLLLVGSHIKVILLFFGFGGFS